jgi:hypothetical protein
MKRLIIVGFSALLLIGCSDEKTQYQEHVFNLMKNDQDLIDYSLDPDEVSRCIVDLTGKKMIGPFSWDPRRAPIYKAYTNMVKLKLNIGRFDTQYNNEVNPKDTLDRLKLEFGSTKALSDANRNFSKSVLTCFETLVQLRKINGINSGKFYKY